MRNWLQYRFQNCRNPLLQIFGFFGVEQSFANHLATWSTKHVQDGTGSCSRLDVICFLFSGVYLFGIWGEEILDIAEDWSCTSLWSLGVLNLMLSLSKPDFYELCCGCALKFRGNLVCSSAEANRTSDFCLLWAVLLLLLYDVDSEI